MKRVILLASILGMMPLAAQSSNNVNNVCAEDKGSAECQAYISGLVEGYVASKQNYLETSTGFDAQYANRAYANRVGVHRVKHTKAERACLPETVDMGEITEHLKNTGKNEDVTKELGKYLRENFPCN